MRVCRADLQKKNNLINSMGVSGSLISPFNNTCKWNKNSDSCTFCHTQYKYLAPSFATGPYYYSAVQTRFHLLCHHRFPTLISVVQWYIQPYNFMFVTIFCVPSLVSNFTSLSADIFATANFVQDRSVRKFSKSRAFVVFLSNARKRRTINTPSAFSDIHSLLHLHTIPTHAPKGVSMVTDTLPCRPLYWVRRPGPLGAVPRSRDKRMTLRSRLPTRLHILGLPPARLRPVQCPTVCITWVTGDSAVNLHLLLHVASNPLLNRVYIRSFSPQFSICKAIPSFMQTIILFKAHQHTPICQTTHVHPPNNLGSS